MTSKETSSIEKLFNPNQTPRAKDYFDENGKLLIEWEFTPVTYKLGHGSNKYEIWIREKLSPNSKRAPRKRKNPYVKFENLRTIYRPSYDPPVGNNQVKPLISANLSFEINPNSYEAKLFESQHIAAKSYMVFLKIKDNPNDFQVENFKRQVDQYIKKNNIKVNIDNIKYHKFVDRVSCDNLIKQTSKPICQGIADIAQMKANNYNPDSFERVKNDITKWRITKVKIPLQHAKDPDNPKKSVYCKNPKIQVRNAFRKWGVKFCNVTLKGDMMRAKKRLAHAEKNNKSDARIQTLKDEYYRANTEYRENDRIEWDITRLNLELPQSIALKYLGVTFETIFTNNIIWVNCQLAAKHVWYIGGDIDDGGDLDDEDDYELDPDEVKLQDNEEDVLDD
jgi:hypothetical protein